MNIIDYLDKLDDKTILFLKKNSTPYWNLSEKYQKIFTDIYDIKKDWLMKNFAVRKNFIFNKIKDEKEDPIDDYSYITKKDIPRLIRDYFPKKIREKLQNDCNHIIGIWWNYSDTEFYKINELIDNEPKWLSSEIEEAECFYFCPICGKKIDWELIKKYYPIEKKLEFS